MVVCTGPLKPVPAVVEGGMAAPPLRVLVLITLGEPGGAQVHVRDLITGLAPRLTFALGMGAGDFLHDEVAALGVGVHRVAGLQRAVSKGPDRTALRALRALIRQTRPHLVHTHSTKAGLLGRIAARLEGVPCVHTAHAWSFSDGQPWRRVAMAVPLEAAVGRLTDRFIVVSGADREVALRYRVVTDAQVHIVHNGVVDSPLRAIPGQAATPTLTMVARMAHPKDHELLLRALAGVRRPFVLRLVGDGPDRPRLERRVAELGLTHRVEWLGVRRDVAALLADSQVFALISLQEGFPLAVLEAMRAGLPVVASRVGGIAEAVTHGETGFLVERGDELGLRRTLEGLFGDPALRASMGAAGRAAYAARFTVGHMLDRTAAVYRSIAVDHGLPEPLPGGVHGRVGP